MIELCEFEASKADAVLDEFQRRLSSRDAGISELLSPFCWCIGHGVSIPQTSQDIMMSRLKNHGLAECTMLLMSLPVLREMSDSHKQTLCSSLLKPESSSMHMISVAVCALLTSKLPNQVAFIHAFISVKGSPFINISNLKKLSRISRVLAKNNAVLKEECANCILKASHLIKKIKKHGSSKMGAFKAITVLLRAISVFCLFTFTDDLQDILYDIEGVIKSSQFSEDEMKCVLEMLMACLSKESIFWRAVCNTAFFHLAEHSSDHVESIISHIFEALNKNDSFLEVEEDGSFEKDNSQAPPLPGDSSAEDDSSVCSEDMMGIEKHIAEYIRMQKNTALAETKKKGDGTGYAV